LCYFYLPHLLSFPTRRSSDLVIEVVYSGTPTDIAGFHAHAGGPCFVIKVALAVVSIQTIGVICKMGLEEIQMPIQIVVSDSYAQDRKSTRLNSSHLGISYAVF